MTPRHRLEPVKAGGAVRRAVVTSVLSALALTSVTITAAAVTLADAEPNPRGPVAAPPPTTSTTASAWSTFGPPVEIEDPPIGIPQVPVVAVDGPVLADIPSMALAAYQRAEAVLKGADESCHLGWTLIAAVGQVVSQHGAQSGGTFDDDGVLHPKLKGAPITGDDGKKLPDSDAGQVDGDKLYDVPVGPMQLAPPTWAIVGVDSDGDGSRNPHDIDDASLAVAVLLCSGEDDLSKRPGRVAGVTRVNDDPSFVESVLAADRAYTVQLNDALNASPTVIPTDPFTDIPTDLTDLPSDTDTPSDTPSNAPGTDGTGTPTWTPSPSDTDSSTPTETPSDTPSSTPSDTPSGTPSGTPSDSPSFSPSDTPSRSDTPSASATDPSST